MTFDDLTTKQENMLAEQEKKIKQANIIFDVATKVFSGKIILITIILLDFGLFAYTIYKPSILRLILCGLFPFANYIILKGKSEK